MKILLVHNSYQKRGGEDFVVDAEAELLRSNGHQVEMLFFNNDAAKSLGGKLKTGIGLMYNPGSAKKIRKKILDFNPDMIHVHNIFYTISPAVFYVAKEMGVPVVLTFHNYRLICSGAMLMREKQICELCIDKTFPLAGIKHGCHRSSSLQTAQLTLVTGMHKVLKTWKNKIDGYIVLTDFVKEKVTTSSLALDPNKVNIKPNFVPDLGLSPMEDREDFFLFIGRLSEEKGVKTLLESTKYLDYKLEIIGDGPLRPMVESYMKDNPNITFWGFRDKEFISDRLGKCTAMLFTSINYEGMPLTILEAYSKGTPVISSDINNINRIVIKDQTGLHFETAKPKPLAEQISQMLKDRSAYAHLYAQARAAYDASYSPDSNYKRLMEIYQGLLPSYQSTRVSANT